jgi:aspartate/methionine/tyrosine aminotransferase
MEAIVFGGRKVVVPAALEGMRDLTVTLGGVACEQRMIGWRIGWIVACEAVTPQLGMVHIYNGRRQRLQPARCDCGAARR